MHKNLMKLFVFVFFTFYSIAAFSQQTTYQSRWDRIGGSWTTGWVPNHSQPICGHQAAGCNCGGQNYCGTYKSGASAYWWPHGCAAERWTIKCTSVSVGGPKHKCQQLINNPSLQEAKWHWYNSSGFIGESLELGGLICHSYARNRYSVFHRYTFTSFGCSGSYENCKQDKAKASAHHSGPGQSGGVRYNFSRPGDGDWWGIRFER